MPHQARRRQEIGLDARYIRRPGLLLYWRNGEFVVDDFARNVRIRVSPAVVQVLNAFSSPKRPSDTTRALSQFTKRSLRALIDQLRRLRFLVPLRGRPPEALEHWAGSMAV